MRDDFCCGMQWGTFLLGNFIFIDSIDISVGIQAPATPAAQDQTQSSQADHKWEELIKSVNINFANQGDFCEGAVLGNGAFGLVSKIMHRKSRLLFASKSMVYSPTPMGNDASEVTVEDMVANQLKIAKSFLLEIQSHQRVRHPNIVKCFGGWTQQTGTDEGHYDVEKGEFVCKFSIILEFMGGGTLSDVVLKRESPSTSVELHRWIFQITLGLREIHRAGFTHFDLKPDNVLLTTKLNAKVADLGGMAPAGQQRILTPGFEAPEEGAGPAYDMFALGLIILCCSLTVPQISCDPIAGNQRISIAEKLKDQPAFDLKTEPRLETFFQNKTVASEIVEKLLVSDPDLRLNALQCLTEMSTVPPEQFTLAGPREVIQDPLRHEETLEAKYSDDGFEAIIEPADPMSWIRISMFAMCVSAAFLAVLTQFSIALSPPTAANATAATSSKAGILNLLALPVQKYKN
jgi:serine/threonine protein kinase